MFISDIGVMCPVAMVIIERFIKRKIMTERVRKKKKEKRRKKISS